MENTIALHASVFFYNSEFIPVKIICLPALRLSFLFTCTHFKIQLGVMFNSGFRNRLPFISINRLRQLSKSVAWLVH